MVNPEGFEKAAEALNKLLAVKQSANLSDSYMNEVILYLADLAKKFSEPSVADFVNWIDIITTNTDFVDVAEEWFRVLSSEDYYGDFHYRFSIFEQETIVRSAICYYMDYPLWRFLFKLLNISEEQISAIGDLNRILADYTWERFIYTLRDYVENLK